MSDLDKKLTYKDSGVDKEAGYEAVKLMKGHVKKTFVEGVISDVGGFGGLFALNKDNYDNPVLVSGTDGVGTKLKVAFKMDKHNTIGQDCVAMCVNDILCQGAKPLFFLDYIATGKIEPGKTAMIVEGIANGCVQGGCALIGGETAEMPGIYSDGEYDLAGFAVGVVDRAKLIDGSRIEEEDIIIGLPSSGVHSNGFSLLRKLFFEIKGFSPDQYIDELGTTIGEELLKPTRIYTKPLYELVEKFDVRGISHITGGGFYENIPRMLPTGFKAFVNVKDIDIPPIFELTRKLGNIDIDEMFATFNMGVGIVMVVNKDQVEDVLSFLKDSNEKYYIMGEIRKGQGGVEICHQ